jgi:hypothetical protein|tara:strand:+ start:7714 stop:7854 length:141 start_codon:yes stop_codon:yes gene_type:complete
MSFNIFKINNLVLYNVSNKHCGSLAISLLQSEKQGELVMDLTENAS